MPVTPPTQPSDLSPTDQPYRGGGIYADQTTTGNRGTGVITDTRTQDNRNIISTPFTGSTNVATLANPNTIKILGTTIQPKAFGEQLLNTGLQTTIAAVRKDKLFKLLEEKKNLIQEGIQLEINHRITVEKIEQQFRPQKQVDTNPSSPTYGGIINVPPKITKEEYDKLIAIESGKPGSEVIKLQPDQSLEDIKALYPGAEVKFVDPVYFPGDVSIKYKGNYPTAKKNLETRKAENEQNIKDLLKDREEKRKAKRTERKNKKEARKARTKEEKRKARKDRLNKIFKQAGGAISGAVTRNAKNIAPVLITLLIGEIEKAIAQNKRIGKLVDDTNKIIESANLSRDPIKLKDAIIRRDNAVKIIEDNEKKIQRIVKQIETINLYINIFNNIVNVLTSIPIPTAVPPGIGIPVNVIMRIVQILFYISKILETLTAYIPDVQTSLNNIISILNGHKARLLNVNESIETAASSSISNETTTSSNLVDVLYGSDYEIYKGFKFAIRKETEENTTSGGSGDITGGGRETRGQRDFGGDSNRFVRHYAVAINKSNIEVLRSESSFTLDPNDLIEQLKIVIDQRGLQG